MHFYLGPAFYAPAIFSVLDHAVFYPGVLGGSSTNKIEEKILTNCFKLGKNIDKLL